MTGKKTAWYLVQARLACLWLALFTALPAHATINSTALLDNLLERYESAARSWSAVVTVAASRLFWTLVVISMVWTFGMMALRQANLAEFFTELIRFIFFTGLFWWLLINGPDIATSIYDSLTQLAGNATGLGGQLSSAGLVDTGFALFDSVQQRTTDWPVLHGFTGMGMALLILILLALVGLQIVVLFSAAWILAYGGLFLLGFGGGRWTSDIAINYYKTVLAVAVQLMAMVFLTGIGKSFFNDYYSQMSSSISLNELSVLLVGALALYVLVTQVPALLATIVTGAYTGRSKMVVARGGVAGGMVTTALATGGAAISTGAVTATREAHSVVSALSRGSSPMTHSTDTFCQPQPSVQARPGSTTEPCTQTFHSTLHSTCQPEPATRSFCESPPPSEQYNPYPKDLKVQASGKRPKPQAPTRSKWPR